MNAANEAAVDAFLKEKIGFYDITDVVRSTMETVGFVKNPDIGCIFETNREAFAKAKLLIDKISR